MRRIVLSVLVVAWAISASTALAQEPTTDLREIAAALAKEQARISELQAELDQRRAALAELARRLPADKSAQGDAQALATAAPVAVKPVVVKEVAAVAPASAPRFEFYGDTKVRYETLNQDYPGCIGCPDRKRGRLRLRFGAEGNLSPDFKAVMGFSAGEINDPNSVYVNLGNKFSRKVVTWDRGYIEYRPQAARWLDLTAGKFPQTWVRSSMVFDVDFYPEGLTEKFSFDLPHAGPLTNVGLQGFQLILGEQSGDRRTTLTGEQFTGRFKLGSRVSTLIAATAVDIERPDPLLRALLDGTDVGVRNTNEVILRDGLPSYASKFRYANLIVENKISTPWPKWPLTVAFELQRNLGAVSSRNTAKSVRVDLGRSQQPDDWFVSWHWFRSEQDAILSALGESDWRGPSNVEQQRFEVNHMITPNVQLGVTLYRGRTLDSALPGSLLPPGRVRALGDTLINRMYWDVSYRF